MCAAHRPVCQCRCPKVPGLLCQGLWLVRDGGFPSPWPWGFSSTVLLPTTGCGQFVYPSFPCVTKWPHHTTLAHHGGYYQLLCQRTVVTKPYNAFISPLLLLPFCFPLLQPHGFLFNYPHARMQRSSPSTPNRGFPWQLMLAAPCFPSQPLPPWGGLSSVLGNVSMQAAETWHGKANPSDTEVVMCFPQRCREVGVGRIHPVGSCSIHLSVQPGFTLSCLLWCQTHTFQGRFAWTSCGSG